MAKILGLEEEPNTKEDPNTKEEPMVLNLREVGQNSDHAKGRIHSL